MRVSGQLADALPLGDIPEPQRRIVAAGQQAAAVRRQIEVAGFVGGATELADALARFHAPRLHRGFFFAKSQFA